MYIIKNVLMKGKKRVFRDVAFPRKPFLQETGAPMRTRMKDPVTERVLQTLPSSALKSPCGLTRGDTLGGEGLASGLGQGSVPVLRGVQVTIPVRGRCVHPRTQGAPEVPPAVSWRGPVPLTAGQRPAPSREPWKGAFPSGGVE